MYSDGNENIMFTKTMSKVLVVFLKHEQHGVDSILGYHNIINVGGERVGYTYLLLLSF